MRILELERDLTIYRRVFGDFCKPPCDKSDCLLCSTKECPALEPLHRDKDGCPKCSVVEAEKQADEEFAALNQELMHDGNA